MIVVYWACKVGLEDWRAVPVLEYGRKLTASEKDALTSQLAEKGYDRLRESVMYAEDPTPTSYVFRFPLH